MTPTKLRARFARPEDLNSLWWLERLGNKVDVFPYALFRTYIDNDRKGKRHTVVVTSRKHDDIIAFAFFRYNKLVHCTNLVVHPEHRRKGIGRKLIQLLGRLPDPFPENAPVVARVRESELDTQLFLKSAGFSCVGITPAGAAFVDPEEPSYDFLYEAPLKP